MDARELADFGKSIAQKVRGPTPAAGAQPAERTRAPAADRPAQTEESIREIPLGELVESPYQPRQTAITDKDVEELVKSISAVGQLSPAIVSPAQGEHVGKYYVLSGHRRWHAMRLLGRPTLRAIVRTDELATRAARKIALADNLGREDLNAYDLAMSFKAHCEESRQDYKAGAEDLGLTRRQAARLEAVLRASEPLLAALRTTGVSARVAEHLARVDARDMRKAVRLAERYAAGDVSAKEIESLAESPRTNPRTQRALKDVELAVDARRVRLSLNVPRAALVGAQRERVMAAMGAFMGHTAIAELAALDVKSLEVVTTNGEVSP